MQQRKSLFNPVSLGAALLALGMSLPAARAQTGA
ncbi:MAG: hypothetical protein RJA44_919, partial [Pseudomonadota bacterium]